MESGDLEVIPPEGEQPAPRRPRRRWPWLAVLGVVAIGAATYALTARAAVRALEQHWLTACDAAVRAQSAVTSGYRSLPLLPEEGEALQKRATDVETRVLADIRAHVRRVRAIDPGVRKLRDTVYEAAQPLNVNSCSPPRSDPPRPIDAILRAELKRWHLDPAMAVASPVTLPPITVTTLPIATERTGSTLALGTGSSVFVVDIDAGTTREIRDVSPGFVSGRGWLVSVQGGHASLERLGDASLPLGIASYVAPSSNDDSVWLVVATGELVRAREVETRRGTGRGSELTLPPFARLAGAVSDGLVLVDEPSGMVEVWDPIVARTRLAVGVTDVVPVAQGNLIAWSRCELRVCGLHFTDASTAQRWTVPLDGRTNSLAISPDGQTVAAAVQSEYRNVGDIELVDAATGDVQLIRSSWTGPTSIAWGRAGDRIFLVSGLARELWMYGISAGFPSEQLRVRIPSSSPFDAIAVL